MLALAFGAFAVIASAAGPAPAGDARKGPFPEELVFYLQYIASDYDTAVRGGAVLDRSEYAQMQELSASLLAGYDEVRPRGAARADLERLRASIASVSPAEAVRSACKSLVPRLVRELGLSPYPAKPPDLERGLELYRRDCASCHGPTGGGDGPAAIDMIPAPTSFRDARGNRISPYEVFNATSFGVRGTDMPSHREGRSRQDLWAIAFFVMTLRDGFDARKPDAVVPLSLADVAASSNEDLLGKLRAARPEATASEVDYYRASRGGAAKKDAPPRAASGQSALEVAETLEGAFADAADRIMPSVVGISIYEKGAIPAPVAEPGQGWKEGSAEDDLYPGLNRGRTGSGFLVGEDGYVLTTAGVILGGDPTRKPEVIDVELPGNVHCRGRVIGLEPTIELAVLKIDPPVPVKAAPVADSDRVRVGQWAIAVGDPPGPAKIFAPGTIAARPERECYQEHRTSTLLQSSAAMAVTGFGGPLVNIRGEVIGLTIPRPGLSLEGRDALVGPVDALPIDLVLTVYRALRVKESERSPWIGISVLDLSAALRKKLPSSPRTGIYIDDLFVPSPASRADVRVGDILTAMNGNRILGVPDFQRWLYLIGIGAPVTLELERDGETLRKEIVIEDRPESARMR
jgi:S1-C subfamily serine protease